MKSGMPVSVSYSISGPALIVIIVFLLLVVIGLAYFIYKKLTTQKINANFKSEEKENKVEELNASEPTQPIVDNTQYEAPTFDNQFNQPLPTAQSSAPTLDAQPLQQQANYNQPMSTNVLEETSMPQQPTPNVLEPNTFVEPQPTQPYTDPHQNLNNPNNFNNNF